VLLIRRPGIVNKGSVMWMEVTGQGAYLCMKTFDWCDGMYELVLQSNWVTLLFLRLHAHWGHFKRKT
jgi:hypothetical protein